MKAFEAKYFFLAGARYLWSVLPAGGSLPEDVWRKRHRFLLGLTWFHAVIIALVGPVVGYSWRLSFRAPFHDGTVLHTVAEGLIVAVFAVLGNWKGVSRALRATLVGFGLISSSAILVHLSGGYIELHFHFFVMLVFMALYQDWVPYGLAVLYVAVHHGVVGVLWPTEVYNHPAAINAPWTWAGIHAFFVLWSCVGSVIAWRFNEVAFAQTKLILDSAGEGFYGLDLDGKTTFVNPAAAKMLGWEVRELIGRPMHNILHHSRADGTPYPREECPIYAAFRDGAAHRVTEEVFWRQDGTSFPVEYLSTPIIERGELTGAVVTFMDVTERKRAESARRAVEARFAGILDIAADAIIAVDDSQHIILFNKGAEQIFGYSSEEVLGQPLDLLLPPRFAEAHRRHIRGFAAASEPARRMSERREVFGQRRDGTEFPAEASISKLTQDGKTIFTVILRDISERKQAEERTQRNLEGIRALREIDKAITSTLDLHDILNVLLEKIDLFLPYATATVRLFNKESGLLEPVACRNLDEKEWKEGQGKAGRGPANVVFETKAPMMISNCYDDPRVRDPGFFRKHALVSYLGVPLIAKGEILGVLSFYTKEEHEYATEEVEFLTTLAAQAAIAIHNSEVYEELAKLAGNLSKANRVKDEFLSVMSHELRTPLNVVMGYTGMMRDGLMGEINPEQEKALEKVISRARDQLTMISGILQATQIEAEGIKMEKREVSLKDLLGDLKSSYSVPPGKELSLIWDYPSDLPVIHTDGEKLKQVLQNLISNAIKFTEKGNVTVAARIRQQAIGNSQQEEPEVATRASRLSPQASDTWVELRVSDTGIGIEEEHLPVIFERFRQVDSSETRHYGGVGIGLYIAKQFTELLGGRIEVESEPGKGSTFTISIPCKSQPFEIRSRESVAQSK